MYSKTKLRIAEHRVPNFWDRVTAISTCLMAVATLVAVGFAGFQIHELREEAKVQHLVESLSTFDDPNFVSVRKRLALARIDQKQKKLRPLDPSDAPTDMYDELNRCTDLGLLTELGVLDRHNVWSEFGGWLFPLYADAWPVVEYEQKKGPAVYKECSSLVESIRPIEMLENKGEQAHPSVDDIYDYYIGEIDVQPGQVGGGHPHSKPEP